MNSALPVRKDFEKYNKDELIKYCEFYGIPAKMYMLKDDIIDMAMEYTYSDFEAEIIEQKYKEMDEQNMSVRVRRIKEQNRSK